MELERGCERCRELEARCRALEEQLARTGSAPPGPAEPGEDQRDVRGLTAREREVLDLIAEGRSTREIADDLYLSGNSVKTHTRKLFRKLRVTNRTEAAVWALRRPASDRPADDEGPAPVA